NLFRWSVDANWDSACLFFSCHARSEPSTQVYTASTGNATSSMCDTANSGTVGNSVVSLLDNNEVTEDSLALTVGESARIVDGTRSGRRDTSIAGDSGAASQNSISHANARPSVNCPLGSHTGRYI